MATILREWGRIGCVGFGGPPTHIKLLRDLCVERRKWLDAREFEDAIAACNLLPGPASTQLAIFCAWRLRGRLGALVGGAAFIVPGLIVILALAALFLSTSPPLWVLGAGAGAAVPAVAIHAGAGLTGAGSGAGGLTAGCSTCSPALRRHPRTLAGAGPAGLRADRAHRAAHHRAPRRRRTAGYGRGPDTGGGRAGQRGAAVGGLGRVQGRGAVLRRRVRHHPADAPDAVSPFHWMTGAQFLNAVALGQITPGPVVQTVAVVGYAAAGLAGGVVASVIAFSPSFAFILLGAHRFDQIRGDHRARAFLDGAGPAAIGAIYGSAIPLTRALSHPWQYAVLTGALILLLLLRRGVVLTLLSAGAAGVIIALTVSSALH
jgi:chromate transporter